MPDVLKCESCEKKMIEDETAAITECPFCGSRILKVVDVEENNHNEND